ncbi:hypothetical protein JCM5353_004801 [Sporobolomyces roseus]
MTDERPTKRPRTVSPPPVASTSTLETSNNNNASPSNSSLPHSQPTTDGPSLTPDEIRDQEEKLLEEKWRMYEMIQEEYHDIINELPLDYQRTFILLRELDSESTQIQTSLKRSLTSYLSKVSQNPLLPHKDKVPHFKSLQNEIDRLKRSSEDKINLALTLYESVDRHIQRLDSDLALYSDSLLIGLRKGTLPSHDAPQAPLPSSHDHSSSSSSQVGEGEGETGMGREKEKEWNKIDKVSKAEKKRDKKKLKEKAEDQGGLLVPGGVTMGGIPIGEDEEIFCYCRRVAFGEMVACENSSCPREWFHLECLGMTSAPKGDYYCDECRIVLGMEENEEVVSVVKKRGKGKAKDKEKIVEGEEEGEIKKKGMDAGSEVKTKMKKERSGKKVDEKKGKEEVGGDKDKVKVKNKKKRDGKDSPPTTTTKDGKEGKESKKKRKSQVLEE